MSLSLDKLFIRHYNICMAFIRFKWIRGKKYYYLVESKREGGKIKQRVLKYLGTSIPGDIESIKREFRKADQESWDDS